MKRFFVVAAVCFNFVQVQDAKCKVFCRSAAGYDSGLFVESTQSCWCANRITDERLNEKRLNLPSKGLRTGLSATAVREPLPPMRLPWED